MSVDRSEFLNRPFAAGHVGSLPEAPGREGHAPRASRAGIGRRGPLEADGCRSRLRRRAAGDGWPRSGQRRRMAAPRLHPRHRRHRLRLLSRPEARALGHFRHRASPGRAARTDRRGGPLPGRGDGPCYQGVHTVPVSTGCAAVGRRAVRRRLPYPRLVHRRPCAGPAPGSRVAGRRRRPP